MRTSKHTDDPFEFLFLFENIMKANGIKDFKINAHHDVADIVNMLLDSFTCIYKTSAPFDLKITHAIFFEKFVSHVFSDRLL